MRFTKTEFKKLWDSNDDGGGITYDDCADCAVAWGICSSPKTKPIGEIKDAVVRAAECEDVLDDW